MSTVLRLTTHDPIACHAALTCTGMEGFLVCGLSASPTPSWVGLGVSLNTGRTCTALRLLSIPVKAYQVSHRRGVLLHGTPFLFVATPNPSWLGSGRKSLYGMFLNFVKVIKLPLFLFLSLRECEHCPTPDNSRPNCMPFMVGLVYPVPSLNL